VKAIGRRKSGRGDRVGWTRVALVLTVVAFAAVGLAACGSSSSSSSGSGSGSGSGGSSGGTSTGSSGASSAPSAASYTMGAGSGENACSKAKPCTVYVSLNFAGNPIREQLLKTVQLAEHVGVMAGTIKVVVSQAGDTVQSQAQDIQNIASKKPAMLVILPSSTTGLDAAIQTACAQGVTVVSFDSPVNASCAYNTGVDFPLEGKVLGAWLGQEAHGKKGVFLVDQGIPGIPFEVPADAGFVQGIKMGDPNATIKYYQGGIAPGPEKSAVSNALPAVRSDLLGVAAITAAGSVASAIKEGGLKPVPIVNMTGTNSDLQACIAPGQKCFIGATPATEGAYGMRIGWQVRGGAKIAHNTVVPTGWLSSGGNVAKFPDIHPEPLKVGTTVFPNEPPSFTIPYNTTWLPVTPAQVTGS
jgi:ribose transport system substrate-binding protein